MSRPRILLDVDGPLADFHRPCLDIINELTGREYTLDMLTEWNLFEALGVSETVKSKTYARMKESGWCSTIPVCPGAVEGVELLRSVADVYACTSPMNGPTWTHERDGWLSRHFGFTSKQIIHTSAKYVCAGDMLIDDKIENLDKWKSWHPGGLAVRWIMPQYSKHVYKNGPSTSSWEDIADMIKNHSVSRRWGG